MNRWTCGLLAAAVAIAFTLSASRQPAAAQGEPPAQPARKAKKPRANQPPPELSEEDQLSPRQLEQRPARPGRPSQPAATPGDGDRAAPTATPAAPAHGAQGGPGSRAIACSGPFGKQSSHLKLAQRFDSRNITFTEVDGPEGTKLRASVLFPNDPKRRLEILWQNDAARSDTHLIVINGQSTWTAPRGLRLGLTLPALEKLNGKPFRLKGFDHDAAGQVTDWQGGALEKLPGDCRLGIRFAADPKASPDKRSEVAGDKEFASSDAAMRAVAPKVAEIILGY
jgi:hypothetical protein